MSIVQRIQQSQTSTQQSTQRERVKSLLKNLASHCPPKLSAEAFAEVFPDYVNDLALLPIASLEWACQRWRTHGKPFFPKISELVGLANQHRQENTVREYKPPEPKMRYVHLTQDQREDVQTAMNRAQSMKEGPMKQAVLSLGAVMLRQGKHWVDA